MRLDRDDENKEGKYMDEEVERCLKQMNEGRDLLRGRAVTATQSATTFPSFLSQPVSQLHHSAR